MSDHVLGQWNPEVGWRSHLARSRLGLQWVISNLRLQLPKAIVLWAFNLEGCLTTVHGIKIRIAKGDLTPVARQYYVDTLKVLGFSVREVSQGLFDVELPAGVTLRVPEAQLFPLVEIYGDNVYLVEGIDLGGKNVIDVGTSVGDSTVFFASKGAQVLGIECLPSIAQLARYNVSRNRLDAQVTILTKRFVGKPSNESNSIDLEGAMAVGLMKSVEVLKLDCDGCESNVILNTADQVLNRVRRFLVEYDSPPAPMIHKLDKLGYITRRVGGAHTGYLYASKRAS